MIDFDSIDRQLGLPQLAWGLTIRRGSVALIGGAGVEMQGASCFEGSWSGESMGLEQFIEPSALRPGELDGQYFFGSAAIRLSSTEVLCIPPTHTLDGIYAAIAHDGTGLFVTNSLIWAMRQAGLSPTDVEKNNRSLTDNAKSTTAGLIGYRRLLYTTRLVSVMQFIHNPVIVNTSSAEIIEKPILLPPGGQVFTFAEYRDGLLSVLKQVLANASAPDRSKPITKLVSTISSGYDSPACAALGKAIGLAAALTVTNGRGARNDSGLAAGEAMGIPVRAYLRPGDGLEFHDPRTRDWYVRWETLREGVGKTYSEFISTLANNGDIYFDPFEDDIRGAVVLTGFHGAIWNYMSLCGPWIRRGDTSGSGLNEFRLRVGFVHVPVPYIFARYAAAVERLSQSREMRPYSYGNPYNKPIPRRLAEEAGADRASFGIQKMAANVMIQASPAQVAMAYEEVAARYT